MKDCMKSDTIDSGAAPPTSETGSLSKDEERAKALLKRDRGSQRAPRISVKSARNKPLQISLEPDEADRLMSAFGTVELGFADLMLAGIINAACDGSPARPPGSDEINRTLAAVTGIGARDEIEGMLAAQMVA